VLPRGHRSVRKPPPPHWRPSGAHRARGRSEVLGDGDPRPRNIQV